MKPRAEDRKFPRIDCNFQAFSHDRFHGGYGSTPASSFLNISRDYFRHEVRRNFIAEGIFFIALMAVLALAIVVGAVTIIHFLQLPAD
jgi:hypothetical protein